MVTSDQLVNTQNIKGNAPFMLVIHREESGFKVLATRGFFILPRIYRTDVFTVFVVSVDSHFLAC